MNTENQAMLHILCGKIASGKSTLARELATQPVTVVVSEDRWLSALFKEEMRTIEDYVRCSAKLRSAIAPHVVSLLSAGVSVVLDFSGQYRREPPVDDEHHSRIGHGSSPAFSECLRRRL